MTNFSMPWVQADFDAKTLHLTHLQKHTYERLLHACFRAGGELPDDDKQLARIAEIDVRTWRKYRAVVLAYFYRTPGGWRQRRVDEDLARIETLRAKRKIAGQKGGLQTAMRWYRKH